MDITHSSHPEKTLRAVLSCIPQIIRTDEVKHSLIEVRFDVILVSRLHKKIKVARIDMPFIYVTSSLRYNTRRSGTLFHNATDVTNLVTTRTSTIDFPDV